MPSTLKNKVVVVTGASAGIGKEAAFQFAKAGACVVIAARRMERLERIRDEIEAGGSKCLAIPTDVSERAQVQHLLDGTLEHFGRVDVWINNAGFGQVGSIEQTTVGEMEQIWRTNFMGAFHGSQVALQQMRRQNSGVIINVSSMAAEFPLPLHGAYTATKYAMNGLTLALNLELEGSGIRACVVMPNVTDTEFSSAVVKKIPDVEAARVPSDSAEKVARRIVQCASNPRPKVMFIPAPPLTLALFDLFPSLWTLIARKFIKVRTMGRGVETGSL